MGDWRTTRMNAFGQINKVRNASNVGRQIKKLEATYGQAIKKGYAVGLKLADSPAYLIYEWLNQNWEFKREAPSR
jgi:hypothetical protein